MLFQGAHIRAMTKFPINFGFVNILLYEPVGCGEISAHDMVWSRQTVLGSSDQGELDSTCVRSLR